MLPGTYAMLRYERVLVRLTAGERVTNFLPKVNMLTLKRLVVQAKKAETHSPANVHAVFFCSDREILHTRVLCAVAKTSAVVGYLFFFA